jgi:hypothetical protein
MRSFGEHSARAAGATWPIELGEESSWLDGNDGGKVYGSWVFLGGQAMFGFFIPANGRPRRRLIVSAILASSATVCFGTQATLERGGSGGLDGRVLATARGLNPNTFWFHTYHCGDTNTSGGLVGYSQCQEEYVSCAYCPDDGWGNSTKSTEDGQPQHVDYFPCVGPRKIGTCMIRPSGIGFWCDDRFGFYDGNCNIPVPYSYAQATTP